MIRAIFAKNPTKSNNSIFTFRFNNFLVCSIFAFCISCIWFYFGGRKAKWCPKCKKTSCEKLGLKSKTDMQAMRCKFCGFNKTIHTPSPNDTNFFGDGS